MPRGPGPNGPGRVHPPIGKEFPEAVLQRRRRLCQQGLPDPIGVAIRKAGADHLLDLRHSGLAAADHQHVVASHENAC